MQKFQVTGKVISVSDVRFIGERSTPVCSLKLDITENPQYPNTPEFQAIGRSTNLLQGLKLGETVILGVTLEGREYEKDGKKGIITNLNIMDVSRMRIEPIKQADEQETQQPQVSTPQEKQKEDVVF